MHKVNCDICQGVCVMPPTLYVRADHALQEAVRKAAAEDGQDISDYVRYTLRREVRKRGLLTAR